MALSGEGDIDFNDWKMNTNYEEGYSADHPSIKAFWKYVEELDNEQRVKLYYFATGSTRLPLGGFKELKPKFTITQVTRSTDSLPTAHTW
jgi:E3 ubiquitin-protein ligase HUWE1